MLTATRQQQDIERSVPARDRAQSETIDRRIEQSALRLVVRDAVGGQRFDSCRRTLNGGASCQDKRQTGERTAGVMRSVH